ncbi:MAG TPA: hypothetical protein VGD87_11330 [Archangium sp.]
MRAPYLLVLVAGLAFAQAPDSRFSAGGYFRIMARPDFQGGNGRLGYWNLNGRLMNEGPYAALEMKLDLLQAPPGTTEIWASLHARLEGGSVTTADSGNGNLVNFRMSQLYARAGNILAPNIIWQLGTLQYFFGDLGLYDLRPAQLFEDTIGLSARYVSPRVDALLAIGDSGFAIRGLQYVPLLTAGGAVRVRLGDHVEIGGGGQVAVEPFIAGNRNSSYVTPNVGYEDFTRKEVLRRFVEENPMSGVERFALPQAPGQTSVSWRAVGYLGFGKLGPIRWNNFFARYQRLHPQNFYTDSWQGQSVQVYIADLTRDRYAVQLGNEMQLKIIPDRLDAVWSVLYGQDRDFANTIAASEANRIYMSTVLRLQLYFTRTVHWLLENSISQEESVNGNLFRTQFDSIFQNTGGVSDTRGLEFGDASVRRSWQLKTGIVLNPTGFGIYARPSIRLLYGFQLSSQHAAFGNAFVERLDQFDAFKPTGTISWHHLVSLESEGWF